MYGWFRDPGLKYASTAKAIRERFSYEDVLIGFDGFSIKSTPPHYLSLSRKLVTGIESNKDLENIFRNIPEEANTYFIYKKNNLSQAALCKDIDQRSFMIGKEGLNGVKINNENDYYHFINCHPF